MGYQPKRDQVGREEFLNAIPGSKGLLEPIERVLNCSRRALRDALRKYPELEEELHDEQEREIDRIIESGIENAKNGDGKTQIKSMELILRAMARNRGFGERLEVTGANGQPLVYLHTPQKQLAVDEWQKKATEFADRRQKEVSEIMDAEVIE